MPTTEGIDRLSSLLERFSVRTRMFHAGPLCGVSHFGAERGHGFLHVMRRGTMVVTHRPRSGAARKVEIDRPSLLFYPRPIAHDFHNAPRDGADFTCASVEFDGGASHPLARALPALVVLPLAEVPALEHTLALLFAETEQVRCGHHLLADRLFEVLLIQLLRWLLDHPQCGAAPVGLLSGLAHPQLAKALVALHDTPGAAWSLQRMAERAGMSRSSFAALFRARVGATPADYLAQWRIAIAQGRLREGRALKTIAQDLGYANASALSRVFTQKVGRSPRHWLMAVKAQR